MRENQTSPAPNPQSLTDRQLVVELLSMIPAARKAEAGGTQGRQEIPAQHSSSNQSVEQGT